MEISSGPFRKSIKLPVAVDTKSSQASYQDGLVEVVLPKAKRVVTRRVDVWTGRVLKQGVRDDTRR
jgi:HSP20 family molecular chaperone IbpA